MKARPLWPMTIQKKPSPIYEINGDGFFGQNFYFKSLFVEDDELGKLQFHLFQDDKKLCMAQIFQQIIVAI
ncbi:hypothetical protein ACPUYX_10480 [Desulfosporosinus sp. SYSU MS00001]|uniref:hypothetical protein n=1 Tax=Desulfosporosinus sp. SYSU MS00001 TaxID=3416284 RepID=UPI003CE82825